MPDLLAGTIIRAGDTPPTVAAAETPSFDVAITSFGTASSGGTYNQVAVVFIAPTTGRVKIHLAARMINSSTSGTLLAPETRAGSTIGSGTVFEAASDAISISHYGAAFARSGACHLLTGLTPGATYNTRLLHRCSSSSGTLANRELIVEPAT